MKNKPDATAPTWKPIAEINGTEFATMKDANGQERRGYLFHDTFHNANGVAEPDFTPVEFLPC